MSHFAAVVFYRESEEGTEFLVVDYTSVDPRSGHRTSVQTKFPGGTNKECPSEFPAETRDRESLEETGLVPLLSTLIWSKEVNQEHTKYGYLVNIIHCDGEIRKEMISDDGDKLSPPYWVPALDLGRILFHSHQPLYMAAMRELGLY